MINNTNSEPTVCFVATPSKMLFDSPPMSYLFLAGWLKVNGYKKVYIVDAKPSRDKDKIKKGSEIRFSVQAKAASEIAQLEKSEFNRIIEELTKYNPDYVGISCFTYTFDETIRLSHKIKNNLNTKIIIGGIHAVLRPHDFLYEGSPVDVVVTGEGERPLLEIIKANGNIDEYYKINGIAFMHRGQKHYNPASEAVDYNLLGPLPYELVDMEWYTRVITGMIRYIPTAGSFFMTSRGCPYRCTFCASSNQKVKFRPLKHIIKEIEYVKENFHIDSFYILDDTFCIGKRGQERVIEFCDLMNDKKYKMTWAMQIRADLVTEKLLRTIKNSGCIQLDFGIETASQKLLDLINKQITVEDIYGAFDLCKKYRIRTFASLMVNLPEETEEDIKMSIDFLEAKRPTVPSAVITVPYIGTKIYEDYVLKKRPDISIDEYRIYNLDNYQTLKYDFFKLCKHNLDLSKIVNYICLKYYRPFDFCLSWSYIRGLLLSKRKREYAAKIFNLLFKPQYWLSLEGIGNLFKKLSLKLQNRPV